METVAVIVVLFFGCQLLNGLDAVIASLITSFNKERRDFKQKVRKSRNILKYHSVPSDIEMDIVQYYDYIWSRHQGVNESEVLSTLPKSLRGDDENISIHI